MNERFDAWWLPEPLGDLPLETLQVGDVECRYPAPTPALVEHVVRSLRHARAALTERSLASIVEAVDAAAARLADPTHPLRQEADRLLPAATGYSGAMATLVLNRMLADWRSEPLWRLVGTELEDPAVLDAFTAVGGARRVRAYGPDLAFHVFAGNVPGVAVTSLIRTLLVKTPSLGKLASGEPVLPVLFARALHSVDPALASALAVTYWPGGTGDPEWRLLEAADMVVVYGGPEAVGSLRERIPAGHRLVVHGPRFSVGLVDQDLRDDPALPLEIARATATFDQHGCVSPQAVWVEDRTGTGSEAFAEALAAAFREIEEELPRGRVSPAEASAIHQARGAAEIRGYSGAARVLSSDDTAWTVILDHEPAFRGSCLNRFLHVHPVEALEEVPALLGPVGHRLQSVAIATTPERLLRLADGLARIGATRITSFDRIPWPPAEWHHDGRGPLRELVRWVDVER